MAHYPKRAATLLVIALAILINGCAATLVGGAAAGAGAAVDRRTAGTFIDDELIELKAIQRIAEDKTLGQQVHTNITSYNGVVLISGEAPTEGLKSRVEQNVRAIPKVRHVHNEMELSAPSTMLSRSSDTYLSAKVKTALLADKTVSSNDIKVVSENGTVYLMGLVSKAESQRATNVVRKVGGVQRVVKLFEYPR
jgi:osmotically-inducible protein OsmY